MRAVIVRFSIKLQLLFGAGAFSQSFNAMRHKNESALAGPAPHRVDEWRRNVRDALTALHEVWTRHIVETEAPGAFLDVARAGWVMAVGRGVQSEA